MSGPTGAIPLSHREPGPTSGQTPESFPAAGFYPGNIYIAKCNEKTLNIGLLTTIFY
jgi:hypothetical protein